MLDEYSKKLSDHWQETRDRYVEQISTKDLDIDDSTPHYDDQELVSSEYVDGALAILAEAFGQAVLVGYDELVARDIPTDVPQNPEELLDEATEIKNYAHSALSYEQQQMDEALAGFSGQDKGKDLLFDWFDNNEYRLIDLVLGGLLWYGIQYGFTRGVVISSVGEEEFNVYWLTERDRRVCEDCKDLESNNPYNKSNPLKTLPGGGKTVCGSRCRCVIDVKPRE